MIRIPDEIKDAILRSWRTSLVGLALGVIAVWLGYKEKLDAPHIVTLLLTAAGLFAARDARVASRKENE